MKSDRKALCLEILAVLLFSFSIAQIIYAANVTSQMTVLSATPSISSLSVNGGTAITLTANATTSVSVNATISDTNGCTEITGGTSTVLLYRSGVGSSTCSTSPNNLNCYQATAFTASSTCSGGVQNTTTTFGVEYYAQATDGSSSFSSQNWMATVIFKTIDNTTGTADSAGVELDTLTAINPESASINYGNIVANTNTGSTDQSVGLENVGNSSTTIQTDGTNLTSGGNTITVNNEHYATSTFTYGGAEQSLSGSATTISGVDIPSGGFIGNIGAWTQTTALPYPDYFQNSVEYNGYLYTIGGLANGGSPATTTVFAPINAAGSIGAWTQTQGLPYTDYFDASVAYNGYLYTIGGNANGSATSTVVFAPANATGSIGAWTQTTPLPYSDYSHASVEYNGYLYAMGGLANGNGTSTVVFAPINATGSIGAWTQTTALPYTFEQFQSSVAYNGYLYAIGGDAGVVTSTVLFAPINATGSIGAWTQTTPLPYSDYSQTSVEYNGYLYAIGGESSSNPTSTVVFAPINATGSIGAWTQTTALPYPNDDHSSVEYNGYVYMIGGATTGGNGTSTVIYSSLTPNAQTTFWGLGVPNSMPTGTYTGTVTFTSVYSAN